MSVESSSWIQVVIDDTQARVFLVIEADGEQTKFRLPNVVSVDYHVDGLSQPVLKLGIGHFGVLARISISPGKSTAEDLLSEIAAARILEVQEP